MTKPSVALIGSFRRHFEEVRKSARIFEAAGMIVKSPSMSEIIDGDRGFVRFESDPPEASDQELQAATLQKIIVSEFVYVVNPGGGTSVPLPGMSWAAFTSVGWRYTTPNRPQILR